MNIRDARIELQKISLDFEDCEMCGKGDLKYLPSPVLTRLENLTRDLLCSERGK